MLNFLILLTLVLISGVLSLAEIAFVSARKTRLESRVKKGSKSAQVALNLANDPDRFLSTSQVGITLTSVISGLFSGEAYAGDLAELVAKVSALEPYAFAISKVAIVVVVSYFTLILGELVPKRIAIDYAEKAAMILAKPMDFLSKIASPVVWFLSKSTQVVIFLFGLKDHSDNNKVTEEEIRAIVQESYEDGEIQEVEQDIVERVFHLGDRTVGSIMTHRSELVWLDTADEVTVVRKKVKENLYNTYPVASDRLDDIKGVVYLKDLFGCMDSSDFSLIKVLQPANFVQENMSVYKTLDLFRQEHLKSGIVLDEFGGVQGIVTLKDIVEALIGEMPDVGEEEDIVLRHDGSFFVNGQCSFYSFLEYFDLEDLYEENDYNTLSGLILQELERVPKAGDRFSWKCFDFEIADMDGARIDKVIVKKNGKTINP